MAASLASSPAPETVEAKCRSCGALLPEATSRFCSACGAAQIHPTEDANLGTVVSGRYRLVRLLGEGAAGKVYEARQSVGRSERRVAVKVLHLQHAENPKLVKRVEREIEIACSLAHPSTIRVFDFGETRDGRPFVVMEYVDGAPLSSLLAKSGAVPLERTAGIFSQVCGALSEAHERGIVHRDLKPENIMLMQVGGQRDLVKVLDFGIAKNISPDAAPDTVITERGTVVGTPEYMSPEQFTGGTLGPATDIYSLGIIAYEMLTGRLPFEGEDVLEWATRHSLDDPPPFDTTEAGAALPKSAEAAVFHALAKRPEGRPPSAAAFYAELAAALPGAPPLGRASSPPPGPASSRAPISERRPKSVISPEEPEPEPEPEPETVPLAEPETVRRRVTSTLPMDFGLGSARRRRRKIVLVALAVILLGALLTALVLSLGTPWSRRSAPVLPPPLPTVDTTPIEL